MLVDKTKKILVHLLTLLFANTLFAQSDNYIQSPFIQNQSDLNIFIQSVQLGDTTTVELLIVNLIIGRDSYKYWINSKGSEKAFYLEDAVTKRQYKFLGQKENCTKSSPCKILPNNSKIATLYFEKIPNTTHRLNLIEGEKDSSWDFIGIDLNRTFENSKERIGGKRCYVDDTYKMPINFFISEYYKVRYYGEIINPYPDVKGKILIKVNDMKIIDPSFASINYLKYKQDVVTEAVKKVGSNELFNEQDTRIFIFE